MAEPPEVTVNTTMGSFTVELYPTHAPKTVQNFVELSRRGYYDNTTFHRIISDFMIQVWLPYHAASHVYPGQASPAKLWRGRYGLCRRPLFAGTAGR